MSRPAATSWWNAGNGSWMRYYGEADLTVRKVRPGEYLATVVTPQRGKIWEQPAGTLASAKSKAEQWARNNL